MTKNIPAGDKNEVDLFPLADGMYTCLVEKESTTYRQKLTKQSTH
jgi:hypothetical protein